MRLLSTFYLTAAVVLAAPAFAEPTPKIAPVPAWVAPAAPQSPGKAKSDSPLEFLYTVSQEKVGKDGLENYVEYSAIPLTTGGLQLLGNIILPWNIERTDFIIHKVTIQRDGKVMDLLNPKDVTVIRRESNLEKATLDGIRTVVIPAKGLEIGDILTVAVSYTSKPYIVGRKPEEVQSLVTPVPITRWERRFLVPDDVKVHWKISASAPAPLVKKLDGMTEHRFIATDLKTPPDTKFAPARYKLPLIQMSAYDDWNEVASQLKPLFDKARQSKAGSPLLAEADKIAAASTDPAQRMIAALRLAQERVRYVALLLDEGAYLPAGADETWERKFGDCKGKTALLLALLDRLGIAAEPMLVSTGFDDRLGEQLPSLSLFDHVMVRARIGGSVYYLDATNYGQRTTGELAMTDFRYGLPLVPAAKLEPLAERPLEAPTREAKIVWDGTKGLDGEIPYEATLTLRGPTAALYRAKLAAAMKMEEFDDSLKNMVPSVSNDSLKVIEKNAEGPDGTFVVRFSGKEKMDWSPFEGEKDTRYQFSQKTIRWDVDFERDEGPGKDWPVTLDGPFWERTIETVMLPNGGKGFKLEADPIDKKLAGSAIHRTATLEGNVATMTADFKYLAREISANEARSAAPEIEKTNDQLAYIVGPREKRKKDKD